MTTTPRPTQLMQKMQKQGQDMLDRAEAEVELIVVPANAGTHDRRGPMFARRLDGALPSLHDCQRHVRYGFRHFAGTTVE